MACECECEKCGQRLHREVTRYEQSQQASPSAFRNFVYGFVGFFFGWLFFG